MSTIDISDTSENNLPNITVNVEDVPVAEPEVAEPEVAEPEVAEPEIAADEVAAEVEDETDDFEKYLKSIGLEKFINKFKINGYDSVESLKNINTSDIRKISKNIKEFKYINRRL